MSNIKKTKKGLIEKSTGHKIVNPRDAPLYFLTIKPALKPEARRKIEDSLKKLGYKIKGGGTMTDMSECDISFSL